MTSRYSWYAIAVLRRLSKSPAYYTEWQMWDQRSLNGLFNHGMFRITSKWALEITNEGWEEVKSFTHAPNKRKDFTRPVFKQARSVIITEGRRKRRKA